MWLPFLRDNLDRIQAILNFERWSNEAQFSTPKGLGRVGLLGSILGVSWGWHCGLVLALSSPWTNIPFLDNARALLLEQWCLYVVALCTFHLLEFFITAIYNPMEASADSYLVNHSTTYTAAALTSWIEFWVRFCFLPTWNSYYLATAGLILVVTSQFIRSLAMSTAGESFNHYIQTSRKDNHVLVTRGIYKYLRHPSYVGFYYWSIGTQLILGNVLHAIAYSWASWSFFRRRIAYEEESLCILFPEEYPEYIARSWAGIPFLYTEISDSAKKES